MENQIKTISDNYFIQNIATLTIDSKGGSDVVTTDPMSYKMDVRKLAVVVHAKTSSKAYTYVDIDNGDLEWITLKFEQTSGRENPASSAVSIAAFQKLFKGDGESVLFRIGSEERFKFTAQHVTGDANATFTSVKIEIVAIGDVTK